MKNTLTHEEILDEMATIKFMIETHHLGKYTESIEELQEAFNELLDLLHKEG